MRTKTMAEMVLLNIVRCSLNTTTVTYQNDTFHVQCCCFCHPSFFEVFKYHFSLINYLDTIDDATISNIKSEDEDNGFKDHLASVLEHEPHKN